MPFLQYSPSLSLHIHRHSRFEFHLKLFLIHHSLFSQPPYKLFIVFQDLDWLAIQKFPHLRNPLFQPLPFSALRQSVLLQFPQAVNLKKIRKRAPDLSEALQKCYKIRYFRDYITPICFANFFQNPWIYAGLRDVRIFVYQTFGW